MVFFWIGLAAAGLIAAVLVICYICYRMAFYSPARSLPETDELSLPAGEIYEPYYPQMRAWTLQTRQIPAREYSIVSFDGLRLYGKYYEFAPGAPIEIMMPGYRGLAERDLCGGVQRAFRLKHSVLLVEQRGCGKSEGSTISFGVNERRDCLQWAQLLIQEFGADVKIILTGISMGAATVTMACALGLPKNVVGIIADCGYSSAREIIQAVIRQMGLPAKPAYPFVRLAARIFGHFDLEATPPVEAIKHCRVPIFIVHGEADDYVPCSMSYEIAKNCTAPMVHFTVPGAGHGLAYVADQQGYLREVSKLHME